MGPQAATGLVELVEAGFTEVAEIQDSDRTRTLSPTPILDVESPTIFTVVEMDYPDVTVTEAYNIPGPSHQPHAPPPAPQSPVPPLTPELPIPSLGVQLQAESPGVSHRPAQRGHTPRRHQGSPLRRARSPRRRLVGPRTHLQEATQHFLSADEQWRNFIYKKHEDDLLMHRERLRIREMELEAQKGWQEIAKTAVEVLRDVVRK